MPLFDFVTVQLSTITFLKSPTPSVPIFIAAEGVGDFRNVIVDNCTVTKSNRGISIQIRDGGNVSNVSFSNIIIETRRFCPDWWGSAEPIAITAFRRDENTVCGKVENIRFFNITCHGENGVLIYGTKDNPIKNVHFENVSVVLDKTSKWDCGLYDLRPAIHHSFLTACPKSSNRLVISILSSSTDC